MLDSLFNPSSVAVIGASTRELHIGNRIIKNLLDFGYKGPIYPVNPKADEVRGIKAYGSILDVPEEQIDVVHMVIPSKYVPPEVDNCGAKGVKHIIVNTAGFKEIGPKGEALENDMLAKAKQHGIRIFGPNCQGIINSDPDVRAYCNFTFTRPDPGYISIVAQSGGIGEVIHQAFSEMGIGTRLYASNGNACDVSIPEILRYYGDDEQTRVIVLYAEGLSDPKAFFEVAQEVAAKKPVLAMKGGYTEEGSKAAASHTGGLAGRDIATELIFEKAGLLTFRDQGELCRAAVAFAYQPVPQGNRVGLITNTGGPAIVATDVLVDAGLEIPPLSEEAEETLREALHPAASINNPIDVLAPANAEQFRAAVDVLLDEEQIDSVYINFVTPFFVDNESIATELVAVNQERAEKPIICNLMTDKRQWTQVLETLKEGGVPCYSLPETAARALVALTRYNQVRSRELGEPAHFDDVDQAQAESILQGAGQAGREFLAAGEVYELLEAYGIPVAGWGVAADAEEAVKVAAEIGFPVVVKADAESILHKSDVGGVAVNLGDAEAVRSTVEEMQRKFDAEDLRFFVQKFMPGGREVIVGARAEEGLGHLVMFGMGGVYVEVLKDVVFKVSPVTEVEAREMLSSIKMAPLLEGVRGEKGVDREKLVEVILRLSQLVTDLPALQEMDLNPVIAYEDGVFVVDARIGI